MNRLGVASRPWLLLGFLGVVVILFATGPAYFPIYTVILLTAIFMYVVLTMSWVIFSGPTGYVSLAPAAFFGVGIYSSAILGKMLPLPLVVVIGGLASFGLALLVGALTLRLKGIYFAIFTFGLVELIKNLLLWWEIHFTGTRGRFVIVVDHVTVYYVMVSILAVLILTAYLIRRSKFGLALQSIGDNEQAAAHIGINVTALKVITFAVSAFFTGAAGAIMATRWTYIDPFIAFNPLLSFMPVLMAIFGGMGQFYGPIVGAIIFGYLEEILITRFPYYYMLLFGAIMVIAILYLPNGLVGLIQRVTAPRVIASGARDLAFRARDFSLRPPRWRPRSSK
ncbi:MAG: branched-chain amino acid ABC transporter permease [Chloroflexi bacterium]|nr:branched-chain amino acid ABC transporter permease [Chloroflexota bacterium]